MNIASSNSVSNTFAAASKPFIENARLPARDVLPVIPPGAKLWAQSGVDPTQTGKIPGRYIPQSGEWCGLGGAWAVEGMEPGLLRQAGSWPTGNVGLRAANWPAVDIDVSSAMARDLIENLVVFHLGPAPVREREGSPRSLLVYRLVGDEPARKLKIRFELWNGEHAVEVLAAGQQYLVAGVHPSKAAYTWREGYDLATWGVDSLGAVTAADLRGLMRAISDTILEKGGRILSASAQRVSATGDGVAVSDLDPVMPTDLALSALRAVPNDQTHYPDRQDFVAAIAAFKAATGREAENYRDEVRNWATAHGWADADYFEHVWRSLSHVRVSPELLLRNARRVGWHEDAQRDFGPMSEEDAAAIQAARSEQDETQEKLATAAKQLVYWPEKQIWVSPSTGELLTHSALDNHAIGLAIAPAGSSGLKAAHSQLRNSGLVRDVVGVTYAPGKPQIMEWTWEGRTGIWFNRWRTVSTANIAAVSDEDIRPFLNHLHWLLPDANEHQQLLKYMAHLIQRPGVKIRWAPVLIGGQGIGKDALLKPLVWALGNHNVAEISPHNLLEKWTFYYESQLVLVQEMLRMDKVEVYERVKAAITGTGAGTLLVEKKYSPAYPIPNTTSFLFLTNHSDAFSIAHDDRRFFVLQCAPTRPHEAEYYDTLHAWYDGGGAAKVARYLRQVDLGDFRADAAPAWTNAKQVMMEETLPLFASWLVDEMQREGGLFAGRTILSANEIRDAVTTTYSIPAKIRDSFTPKAAAVGLRSIGWVRPDHQLRMPDGEKTRVWCANDSIARGSPDMLRSRLVSERRGAPEFSPVDDAGQA